VADDAWLISKQAQFLKEIIAIREVSLELLECVSTLAKELRAQIGEAGLSKHANISHLMERTQELLRESSQIVGTTLGPPPNEMLQQELGGSPNVDGVTILLPRLT
jgi:hypothetical protein